MKTGWSKVVRHVKIAGSDNTYNVAYEEGAYLLNEKYKLNLTLNLWDNFVNEMTPINNGQIAMFE